MSRLRCTVTTLLLVGIAAAAPALASRTWPAGSGSSSHGAIAARPALDLAIVAQLNRVRASYGLRRLRVNGALADAAAVHSREMTSTGLFQHESSDGSAFWKRVERYYGSVGYQRWDVGETLLWSSPDTTASTAVSDWLASPPHRKILLDARWFEVGVSAVHDTSAPGAFDGVEGTIVTADFGARTRRS